MYQLNLPTTWYLVNGIISSRLVQAKTVVDLSPNGIATKDFQEFEKHHPIEYYMAGGVPRYVLQNVEILIRKVIGNNIRQEGRPDAKEMEIVEKEACKLDKIIKCFTKNEETHVKISNRIVHRFPDETH
ncbi:8802_t:CDS:2, partial [Funneliformis geosporum]